MASLEVLDFAALLAPIPGDNPAGRPLREDFSPRAIYHVIKDVRTAARAAERKLVQGEDESQPQGERPTWKPVLQLAPKIIADESKDLEVVAWLIEALVREYGLAGLRDGFRLSRVLVERFWDHLYPLPDEDGIATRVAPLTGLNGEDSDGVLIQPILNAPITAAGSLRAMSLADWRQAADLERMTDPDKRAQRVEQGAVSLQAFEKAVLETPSEFFHSLLEDVSACGEEFEKLCAVMEEKCGKGENGYSLAPPSSNLRAALQAVREQVARIAKERSVPGGETGGGLPGKDQSADGAAGAAGPGTGQVRTREEALRSLLQTAEFFKRTEPHSPIAYLLEQAARWGRMPLPELLAELIPEDSHRAQLFKLVGIRPPEKRE